MAARTEPAHANYIDTQLGQFGSPIPIQWDPTSDAGHAPVFWTPLEQGLDEWDDLCAKLDNPCFEPEPGAAHDLHDQRQHSQPGLATMQATLCTISKMLASNQRAQSLHGRATTLLARQVLDSLRGTQVSTLAKAVQEVRECADWTQQVHQLNTELKVQRYSWEQVHCRLMEAQASLQAREEELLARDQDLMLLRAELEAARSHQSSRTEGQRCLMEARGQEVRQLQADLLARDEEVARLRAAAAAAAAAAAVSQGPAASDRVGERGLSPDSRDPAAEQQWMDGLLQRLQGVAATLSSACGAAVELQAAAVGAGGASGVRGCVEACVSEVEACAEALADRGWADAEGLQRAAEQQQALSREAVEAREREQEAETALAEVRAELAELQGREQRLEAELAAAEARLEEGEAKLATTQAREKRLELDVSTAQELEQSVQVALVAAWEQAGHARVLAVAEAERATQAEEMLVEADGKLEEAERALAGMGEKLQAAEEAERKAAGQTAEAVARVAALQVQEGRWAAAVAAAEARARAAEAAQSSERELAASLRGRLEAAAEAHARQAREAEASKRELAEGLRERQALLQAKLEDAERQLRSAPPEQQQQQQQQLLASDLAAAQDALASERELSESLSEDLGKTQARLAALQQEHGALKREAAQLADRVAVSEEGLEAARQEAEDAAAAARAEAEALRRELSAAEARLRALQVAAPPTEAAAGGAWGPSGYRTPGARTPGTRTPRISGTGGAAAGPVELGSSGPTATPAVKTAARAAARSSASGADGQPGSGTRALREAQGLVAALEQELEVTRSKLQALLAAGQAECCEALGPLAGGQAPAGAGGGDAGAGLHALLGVLRSCEVLHTKQVAGSSLPRIRVLQAQMENVLQRGLAGTSEPSALLQELSALRALQQQQQQQQPQDQAAYCHPADALQPYYDQNAELQQPQQQQQQQQKGLWQDGALNDLSLLEEFSGWGDGVEAESGSWMRVDPGAGGWGDVSSEAGRSDLTALSSSYEGAEQPAREASGGSFSIGGPRPGCVTDGGGGGGGGWDRRTHAQGAGIGGTPDFRFGSAGGGGRRGAVSDDVMAGLDVWDLPPLTPPPKFD